MFTIFLITVNDALCDIRKIFFCKWLASSSTIFVQGWRPRHMRQPDLY
jgi:hypothetical protein